MLNLPPAWTTARPAKPANHPIGKIIDHRCAASRPSGIDNVTRTYRHRVGVVGADAAEVNPACLAQTHTMFTSATNDDARFWGRSHLFHQALTKRIANRFPPDFMFQLTPTEKQEVVTNCDHLARLKFAKTLPFAFTEHGAIQAANVLSSEQAVEMAVYVVRAFVRLREMIATKKELAQRLDDLENQTELMSLKHDTFEHNIRVQLKQIFEAIRELMAAPEPLPKRPIGFVTPEDAPPKPKAAKGKK
jgi:hypothetical protein